MNLQVLAQKVAAGPDPDSADRGQRLAAWANAIGGAGGCTDLSRNFTQDVLLERFCTDLDRRFSAFAAALSDNFASAPKDAARVALNRPTEPDHMNPLAAGPRATAVEGKSLQRLVRVTDLLNSRYGYLRPDAVSHHRSDPAALARHLAALTPAEVDELVAPNATFQSRIRVLFWTDAAALDEWLEKHDPNGDLPKTTHTLLRVLGIDQQCDESAVIFELVDDSIGRHVPSGVDAFDHQYFRPWADDTPPSCGFTRVLLEGLREHTGPPEAVTGVVGASAIRCVQVLP